MPGPEHREAPRAPGHFVYSSAMSRSIALSRRPAGPCIAGGTRLPDRAPPPGSHGPPPSWPAACDSRRSRRWSERTPFSRAQAAVSAALPRVEVAVRPSVTCVAQGPGSRPARRARPANSAPPPIPDEQDPGAPLRQQAKRRLDPVGASGQRHDPIRLKGRLRHLPRLMQEPREPGPPGKTYRDEHAAGPARDTAGRHSGQPGGHRGHGSRRSQRRTVACAVSRPSNPAVAGNPGTASQKIAGSAVSGPAAASPSRPAKGAAR